MIQLRLAIAAVILAVLGTGSYLLYNHVKYIGYTEAQIKYEKVISDYETNLNRKIDTIETLTNTLVAESRENNVLLSQDISTIIRGVKSKPLVVVKNGECNPNQTFVDSLSKINQRANQSIKDIKQ